MILGGVSAAGKPFRTRGQHDGIVGSGGHIAAGSFAPVLWQNGHGERCNEQAAGDDSREFAIHEKPPFVITLQYRY